MILYRVSVYEQAIEWRVASSATDQVHLGRARARCLAADLCDTHPMACARRNWIAAQQAQEVLLLGTSRAEGLVQVSDRQYALCVYRADMLSGAPCSRLQHSLAPVIRPLNSSTAAVSTVAAEAEIYLSKWAR